MKSLATQPIVAFLIALFLLAPIHPASGQERPFSITTVPDASIEPSTSEALLRVVGRQSDGVITTDGAYAMVIDQDDRLLVAGYHSPEESADPIWDSPETDLCVWRFLPDGQPDLEFGENGRFLLDRDRIECAEDIALDSKNRIVVCGTSRKRDDADANPTQDMIVIRLTPEGTLDELFGEEGVFTYYNRLRVNDTAHALALDSTNLYDERILVTGTIKDALAIFCIDEKGNLSGRFGERGVRILDEAPESTGLGIAIDENSKIVVTGRVELDLIVARFDASGDLDHSFDLDGLVIWNNEDGEGRDEGWDVVINPEDGRIFVSGNTLTAHHNLTVWCLTDEGALDSKFDVDGVRSIPFASHSYGYSILLDDEDGIVVGGSRYGNLEDASVAVRLHTDDGRLDPSFGSQGKMTFDNENREEYGQALAMNSKGSVFLAGFSIEVTEEEAADHDMVVWQCR